MSDQFCDKETAVIRAARSGSWEPMLRTHLDSCGGCREAAKLVAAMNSLVLAESDQVPVTPDPQRVWLKAAFAERQKRSMWITRIAGMAYAALAATIGFGAFSAFKSGVGLSGAVLPTGQFTITSAAPVALVVVCALLALLLSSPLTKRQQ